MDKLYKTVLATVTAASVLVCSACAGAPAADQVQDPDAGKTLPEMTKNIAGDDREDYHTCLDI